MSNLSVCRVSRAPPAWAAGLPPDCREGSAAVQQLRRGELGGSPAAQLRECNPILLHITLHVERYRAPCCGSVWQLIGQWAAAHLHYSYRHQKQRILRVASSWPPGAEHCGVASLCGLAGRGFSDVLRQSCVTVYVLRPNSKKGKTCTCI